MTFIQSISFATDDKGAILEVMRRWSADALQHGAHRATVVEDRSSPGRFVVAVQFASATTAQANSSRAETGAFAEQFGALCSDQPTYREFDVVEVYGG